ncbi:phosphoribosylglycinamide formyltransferase [Clostridium thailandense]|uniref:Phosphoribosylglycinamide formyltransferase n=1 Tax=Clostridium thailandense TaxID=2794346 RepID=A0A949WUV5_9CLOT|nr:phosphoribosylglycinamide formyltransferase [Clostridium thailandense]MBV7272992.1 phosphoribosylglycinamide formyltransferase [Clostridium thailandense]MCH5135656.1 phosphoribosylglycinamide formyltransferase [Clostridiaceae bacterium UIB06]
MFKIAVLVSGGGTNLQCIIDAINNGYLKNCSIEAVISDRIGVYSLERAVSNDIKVYVIDKKTHKGKISDEILKLLQDKVDLIVCAGWLSILEGDLIPEFKNKIINIHPSLIPAFCGEGMYGIKVHESAIKYGVKVSGCTVHFVDNGTDTGPIIIQKTVPVYSEDTPDVLQKRILEQEHMVLPEAIKLISEEKIRVEGRKVIIK